MKASVKWVAIVCFVAAVAVIVYIQRFGATVFWSGVMLLLGALVGGAVMSIWTENMDLRVRITQVEWYIRNGHDVPANLVGCLLEALLPAMPRDRRCDDEITLPDGTRCRCFLERNHEGDHAGWHGVDGVYRWDSGDIAHRLATAVDPVYAAHFMWDNHA